MLPNLTPMSLVEVEMRYGLLVSVALWFTASCAAFSGRPPTGGAADRGPDQEAAMRAIGAQVKGKVVWSSSRFGNHDIFVIGTNGEGLTRLTESDHVDWFSRFSPDGRKILFTRSKKGWVNERDANRNDKWDLFTIDADGSALAKVADHASWGSWLDGDTLLFSRATQVFKKTLSSGNEELLLDSETHDALGGAYLQQPQMSPDGLYLAITLRGGRRETGVWSFADHTWEVTGEGCQVNWFPAGERIYWVNPSGNGGSEVFSIEMVSGKPKQEYDYEQMRFIDIPGRRSHEYFPQLSDKGRWLVWAATQRGHDHDIADYEIYIWQLGATPEQATRLTFHSGNDRWPDIHIDGGD